MIRKRCLPPARAAAVLCLLLIGACATRPLNPPFYGMHRDRYAITVAELKTLQFYISRQVIAQAMDGASGLAPEEVILVAAGTPGLALDAGPDWLRVAFRAGGQGVVFRRSSDRQDAIYGLATMTEDGKSVLVSKLPEPILSQGGRRYKIVSGADAYLIVDIKDLGRLIESRPHAGGLKRE
jgi:hypothetical protein